jgi:hypothetical protein
VTSLPPSTVCNVWAGLYSKASSLLFRTHSRSVPVLPASYLCGLAPSFGRVADSLLFVALICRTRYLAVSRHSHTLDGTPLLRAADSSPTAAFPSVPATRCWSDYQVERTIRVHLSTHASRSGSHLSWCSLRALDDVEHSLPKCLTVHHRDLPSKWPISLAGDRVAGSVSTATGLSARVGRGAPTRPL